MTQQEFQTRTFVKVDSKEFDANTEVYLHSDLGKDEFCKLWCKMNRSRVDAAKADAVVAARLQANLDFAFGICNNGYTQKDFLMPAEQFFNKYDQQFIEKRLGIPFDKDCYPYFATVSDVVYGCNLYLRNNN